MNTPREVIANMPLKNVRLERQFIETHNGSDKATMPFCIGHEFYLGFEGADELLAALAASGYSITESK